MKKAKEIDGKLDDAWSLLVKLQAGMICEYCKKDNTQVQLHSHHIFSRSNKATRWDLVNGICLCASHHTLSSKFSAHKTGIEFTYWIEQYRGKQFIQKLRLKALSTYKWSNFEKELLLKDLNKQIRSYE